MRLLAERSALREDAARLLDELGGTVGEVALSLFSMGIRTEQHSCAGDSPVGRYLNAIVRADSRVIRIRITKRWLGLTTHRRWGSTIWVRLPRPVSEFTVLVNRAQAKEAIGVAFEDKQS
jgi:hypothetical protein